MAIRLTRIYTRSGDRGLTALVGGARVPKESARLEAYGAIDELNSIVGIVRSYLPGYKRRFGKDYGWYSESLRRIQNELFDVGSELATPPPAEYAGMHKISAAEAKKLEEEMDRMQTGAEAAQLVHASGRRPAQRLPPPGAHRMPAGRARMLGAETHRADQRPSHGLRQSPERPSVRAIAMGCQAAQGA